jgi:hypothetical protein
MYRTHGRCSVRRRPDVAPHRVSSPHGFPGTQAAARREGFPRVTRERYDSPNTQFQRGRIIRAACPPPVPAIESSVDDVFKLPIVCSLRAHVEARMTLPLMAGSCSIGSHGGESTLLSNSSARLPPASRASSLNNWRHFLVNALFGLFHSRCGGQPPALVRNVLLPALRMDAEDLRQIPLTDRR